MNKLIIAILTAVFMSVSATTFAQDFSGDPGRKGKRNQRSAQQLPVVSQFMRAIRQLELDEAQEQDIKAVMQGLKTEVRPIMEEVKTAHQELKELIKADNYDEQAVADLAELEGKLAANRIVLTGQALSQVLGYLTEEQRGQLDEMAAERKKQRGGKREKRGKEG